MTTLAIADSGVANLASIRSAFRALGMESTVTSDPDDFAAAAYGVVPGVGAFGAGRAALRRSGLDAAITRRAAANRPLLAVCLGMQLLGTASDEDPGVIGLGIIDERSQRLQGNVRIPHLGWNRVEVDGAGGLLAAGDAAFANTYCLRRIPEGWTGAWTVNGSRFVSALQRGRLLATQFHPEKSQSAGLRVLKNFAEL